MMSRLYLLENSSAHGQILLSILTTLMGFQRVIILYGKTSYNNTQIEDLPVHRYPYLARHPTLPHPTSHLKVERGKYKVIR